MLAKSDGKSYHSLLSQISFRTRISNHFKFPQIFFLERVSNPLLPANKQWIEDPRLASERTSPQRLIDGASPPQSHTLEFGTGRRHFKGHQGNRRLHLLLANDEVKFARLIRNDRIVNKEENAESASVPLTRGLLPASLVSPLTIHH